ncbi:MAG: SNF2-related protein [Nitrospiraceae bacterium]|nr:SNF2-related protein [Nitrospiraceae bacterium]MDA8222308.1 SNF2-related protein [Desulfitobacterium hafniense]
MTWQLTEPCEGVILCAENDGVWFRGETTIFEKPKSRLGRLLPILIPQLVELDIAIIENNAVRIPYVNFVELEDQEIDAFNNVAPWSPFAVEIETAGSLGASDLKYKVRFYWGREQIHLERMGCFVKRANKIFRLDKQTFTLIEAIENFNSLPSEEKTKPGNALLTFAEIKGISEDIGAGIDRFIYVQKVIVPSKIGLDIVPDSEGRITFVPQMDNVPSDGIIKAFLASDDVADVYSVDSPDGGRVRVLLNESQKEVLRRMQKVRHLGGFNKAKVLSNPYAVFDGVADSVDINLKDFGPRVKGIGDFPFVSQVFVSYGDTGIFDDPDETTRHEKGKLNVGVKCHYPDGTVEDVNFSSREELLKFRNNLKVAKQTGSGTVDLKGKTIIIDDDFVRGIDEIVERVSEPGKDKAQQPTKRHYLLIYTNESELEYNEDKECLNIGEDKFCIPSSLADAIALKPHQSIGLKWLQLNYLMLRRGCLLADEMGLGKTLQVLAFLAWLIEKGDISPAGINKEKAPWNPILVVAPIMLLENETWVNDMKTFFKGDGSIFRPFLTLHGSELRKFRKPDIKGRETEIESSVLDLEKLRQYRVIFTNYETITNYQYSFAMMKDSWSVVVTDEAQEYKTPNTKISHALKSLSPKFRIACTGTPVETRLIDIWNIFDFLQPGRLGSASEFSKQYEHPILCGTETNITEMLGQIRDKLYFGQQKAFVLRRDKSQLKDLPEKHEHKIFCNLSAEQCKRHVDFVGRAQAGGEGNHPFAMIHQLMKLYQHPDLLPEFIGLDSSHVDDACRRAPKLEKVMEILSDIRTKGEKALIFTRTRYMQDILAIVLSSKFRLNVDIIRGGTSQKGSTGSFNNNRKNIIQRFRNSNGFNVLVLSPDVAGIGLTLVEANHVIHYGRWWNPAKEVQATDRVYRIGQTKDVHVYYPIAREPNNAFKSFDEKLDALLQRRKELAADFLAPMPDESELGKKLWEDIIGDKKETGSAKPLTKNDIRLLPWDRFEALVALIEEKRDKKSLLTPRSLDYGIDVISISGNQAFLIQCKHNDWDGVLDNNVIAETINALENYRGRWLREIANRGISLIPALVTNGKLTKTAIAQAKAYDVQVITGIDLWKLLEKSPCSLAEVEMMESQRMANMREVQAKINEIVNR